ncbi:MAG: penicillin-binding transpeptidase domain-containing protein [Limisphaerales bacterium]
MLFVDQLRDGHRPLRVIGALVATGLFVLAAGLWRVQVLAGSRYVASEKSQSIRLVRVPAVRGKILDRNRQPLAENRPSYDLNVYLDELRPSFVWHYTNLVLPDFRAVHGRRPNTAERTALQQSARLLAYSNLVQRAAAVIGTELPIEPDRFLRHYRQNLALPLPVARNLSPAQVARFQERSLQLPALDLEIEALRFYPHGAAAAHALGHLQRADEADNDPDDLLFRYRLRDWRGAAGLEAAQDALLRGRAGVKALRVDSMGYRHEETLLQPVESGAQVVLALDLAVQAAAEKALARVAPDVRGAAVVLDVQNGDVLALASRPAFDPNVFLAPIPPDVWSRLSDERLSPQLNRAVHGAYPPGSIFKILVALAGLEAGVIDPGAVHAYEGFYKLGRQIIDDTAPPGDYDFKRAFKRSSNAYFIDHGLRLGPEAILAMGRRFRLGERTGIELGGENPGFFPDEEFLRSLRSRRTPWNDGATANLAIGQGYLTMTPLQAAVMTAAIANGGRLLRPRLVLGLEPSEAGGTAGQVFEPVVEGDLGARPRDLQLVRDAMLADVEEPESSGREAFIPGFRIGGKTGTAEIKRGRQLEDKITWFVSFGPYPEPRWAVVVVIESGSSGGRTSAPVARQIFLALQQREAGLAAGRFAAFQP